MHELSAVMLHRIDKLYISVHNHVPSNSDFHHWRKVLPADMTARNDYRARVSLALERLRIEEFR